MIIIANDRVRAAARLRLDLEKNDLVCGCHIYFRAVAIFI